VLLGISDAHELAVDEDLVDVLGPLVGLVDLGGAGRDLLLGDRAHEPAELFELLGQNEPLQPAHRR
jgi:hypothetical protein